MGGACSANGEVRNVYKILVGKAGGKRPLWRLKRRWEDNIKIDFWKTGLGDLIRFIWMRAETSGGLL